MNKQEALIILKSLKYDLENFVSVESTESDIKALEVAINILQEEKSVYEEIIRLLEGLKLYEWEKLKDCIDREFKSQSYKTQFKSNLPFKEIIKLEFNH